jgi:hypothetical protein
MVFVLKIALSANGWLELEVAECGDRDRIEETKAAIRTIDWTVFETQDWTVQ